MKKIFKSAVSLILVVVLAVCVCGICVSADSAVISFSKNEINIGEEVTVNINISANQEMYGVEFSINYDPNILEFVSGEDCSAGAGLVNVAFAGGGNTSAKRSYTFKAISTGDCYIKTADLRYVNLDEQGISVPNQGGKISVKTNEPTVSDNADLKALSVSAGSLSPRFSASKTSYNVTVKNSVTECKIYATAADAAARVDVAGDANLQVGRNTRTVTVTAANGAQKVYTINITRLEEETEAPEEPEQPEEPEINPLETTVDGVNFIVATDLSSVTLPKGFNAIEVDYNGAQVAVASDSSEIYRIYYLKAADSEQLTPYTYDAETNTFTKLQVISQSDNLYIVSELPTGYTLKGGYFATNAEISGNNIKCFGSSDSKLKDFYYVYCYFDGTHIMYRYDGKEGVLQRYPELKPTLAEDDSEANSGGFLERFNSLTSNAKTLVVCLLIAILGAIALIVLLVIKTVSAKRYVDDEDDAIFDNDFDNIVYTNSFMTETEEEELEKDEISELLFGDEDSIDDSDE